MDCAHSPIYEGLVGDLCHDPRSQSLEVRMVMAPERNNVLRPWPPDDTLLDVLVEVTVVDVPHSRLDVLRCVPSVASPCALCGKVAQNGWNVYAHGAILEVSNSFLTC